VLFTAHLCEFLKEMGFCRKLGIYFNGSLYAFCINVERLTHTFKITGAQFGVGGEFIFTEKPVKTLKGFDNFVFLFGFQPHPQAFRCAMDEPPKKLFFRA